MNPGKYRHKIVFLKNHGGKDEYGEVIDDWKEFTTAYSAMDPLLGNEFFASLTTDNKVEVKFNMRFIHGITSEMRIKYNEEVYEIIGPPINVKGLNRELLCYCKLVK